MDYAALVAALAAETVAALASAAPVEITLEAQVYVEPARRAATHDVEAWWRPNPDNPIVVSVAGGGQLEVAWGFELRLGGTGIADASLVIWSSAIRSHFGGRARPTGIAGLHCARVVDWTVRDKQATRPGAGPDREAILFVEFIGSEDPL